MARRHAHKARVVTKFARIPGELPDGKVRCNGCSGITSLTKSGRTRAYMWPVTVEYDTATARTRVGFTLIPPPSLADQMKAAMQAIANQGGAR